MRPCHEPELELARTVRGTARYWDYSQTLHSVGLVFSSPAAADEDPAHRSLVRVLQHMGGCSHADAHKRATFMEQHAPEILGEFGVSNFDEITPVDWRSKWPAVGRRLRQKVLEGSDAPAA